MSNLVHRRRRCARIVLYTILCLEGSTPEDRNSPPGKGYRCGSRGAYFLLPTAAILFSGGLEGLQGRTGSCGIGLLPRRVLSGDL